MSDDKEKEGKVSEEILNWKPSEIKQFKVRSRHCVVTNHPDYVKTKSTYPTAEEVEKIHKDAFSEGYRQGKKKGWDKGYKDAQVKAEELINTTVAQFSSIIEAFQHPFELLDEQIEQELVHIATLIARQIVRREIKLNPGEIVAVVREAIEVLPSYEQQIKLKMHPQDAELIRASVKLQEGELHWLIIEDPTMERGGCVIETGSSRVEANLETRLNAVIANVLGDERQ